MLGIPVTGGNVSFYNQTGETPILPTPVVGILGVIDDVRTRITQGFVAEGSHVLVLGETREELSGSSWADVVHGHLGGQPPLVDLEAERRWPTSWSRPPGPAWSRQRTTSPTAAWPSPSPSDVPQWRRRHGRAR